MFSYLKKKVVVDIKNKLKNSFSKVDNDIKALHKWVLHLNEKSEHIRNSHFQHIEITKKDISEINRWLHYLHAHNTELHKFVKKATDTINDLQLNHTNLLNRLEKLEKGQLGTPERTIRGQLEDMSLKTKDISKHKKIKKIDVIDKSSLTGSQIEILNILYQEDKPLSYADLAKFVGKKKKSIRNLIYEIREKGIGINSKAIGIRKKGFYISKEEKIKVSGR